MRLLILLFVLSCLPNFAMAQQFADLDKSTMDMAYYPGRAAFRAFAKTAEEKAELAPKIRVIYSRPLKNGREIWGAEKMAPFGEAYRLGANENTEIQFYVPTMLGDQIIPAGRYTLGAVINQEKWEVFINTDVDSWGVYAYDATKNVATMTVPTASSEEVIEAFSITLYQAESGMIHLKMGWDKTVVEVPFKLID